MQRHDMATDSCPQCADATGSLFETCPSNKAPTRYLGHRFWGRGTVEEIDEQVRPATARPYGNSRKIFLRKVKNQ